MLRIMTMRSKNDEWSTRRRKVTVKTLVDVLQHFNASALLASLLTVHIVTVFTVFASQLTVQCATLHSAHFAHFSVHSAKLQSATLRTVLTSQCKGAAQCPPTFQYIRIAHFSVHIVQSATFHNAHCSHCLLLC